MINFIEDIGIYTDIHESGNKTKDNHKLYYATCSICGDVVEKSLSDIKRNNTRCYHDNGYYQKLKVNDMPSGWITMSKLNERIYNTWKHMIERTTEKYWNKYPSYKGTTVCEEWRYLSNFVNDIKELNGYDEWASGEKHGMMLDKDILGRDIKLYSKETCQFISHADSNRDVHARHPENIQKAKKAFVEKYSIPVILTNIYSKDVLEYSSLREACRELNLNLRNAWMALSENYPNNHSTGGWEISYKE